MQPNCLDKFVSSYQGGSKALTAQAEKDLPPYLELKWKWRNLLTVHVNASWID